MDWERKEAGSDSLVEDLIRGCDGLGFDYQGVECANEKPFREIARSILRPEKRGEERVR